LRKKGYLISGCLILTSFIVFFGKGDTKYGLDFTGGSVLELRFEKPVKIDEVRSVLKDYQLSIQYIGEGNTNLLLRGRSGLSSNIKETMKQNKYAFSIIREEDIGPVVGRELRGSSLKAFFLTMLGILLYLAFRFEMKYSIGAIIATGHDIIISMGIFCLLGYEIDVPTIAALLTVIGYSVNDTIVIFDRIREYLRSRTRKTYIELIDDAINSTLGRTLLTSTSTLLVLLCLIVFGGGSIHAFAVYLFIGVIVGTYSSVFVAAPMLIEIEKMSSAQGKAPAKTK
ncbi:MAG: protein translocase subunit SecF, partial [Candidatus Aureabacteria bacterium]|nr:protein translocase subunit SecF [Candidatus Auribacterota bacterium]